MNRAELRTRLQVFLDELAPNMRTKQNAELNELLQAGYNSAAALFLSLSDSFYTTTTTINLVSGTELYDLPAGCIRIKAITDDQDAPFYREFNTAKRGKYLGFGTTRFYYLRGQKIGFLDIPNAAKDVVLEYVYSPSPMTSDESIPDVPEFLGHDYIVLEAAMLANAMDEENNPVIWEKHKRMRAQILNVYALRSADFAPTAGDDPALDDI